MFTVYGSPSRLPKISNWGDAIKAAAVLDLPISSLIDGGSFPRPRDEPLWYQYLPADNAEIIYVPRGSIDHFEYGSVVLHGAHAMNIGVSSLWLSNGFTCVTFTVANETGEMEKWERQLIAYGARRQLVGPSIYISKRLLFHDTHRVHQMIWPQRSRRIPTTDQTFRLEPQVMVQLCAHIFSPMVSEVSCFRGIQGESLPVSTTKYPQRRKLAVANALSDIGFTWGVGDIAARAQHHQ